MKRYKAIIAVVLTVFVTGLPSGAQTAAIAKRGANAAIRSTVELSARSATKEAVERANKETLERAIRRAGTSAAGDASTRIARERIVRESFERMLHSSGTGHQIVADRLGREAVEDVLIKTGKEAAEDAVSREGADLVAGRVAREGAEEAAERSAREAVEGRAARTAASEKYARAKYLDEHPELHESLNDEDRLLLEQYRTTRYRADNGLRNVPNTGSWAGKRGDSRWNPDGNSIPKKYNPDGKTWEQILKENGVDGFDFNNGELDLSKLSVKQTTLDFETELSEKAKAALLGPKKDRQYLHMEVFEKMAKESGMSVDEIRVLKGDKEPVRRLMAKYGCSEQEVWERCGNPGRIQRVLHECPDCKTVLLVSKEVHDNLNHSGGVDMFRAFHGL